MIALPPLAFVDIETSGLGPKGPNGDRITEIGVVTVDDGRATEWTTFLNPGMQFGASARELKGIADDEVVDAPRFADIARDLEARLKGRLFIAHNARFDFSFVRAEFERAGIFFLPQVLCTVMLSRKLYSSSSAHDLDTVMRRHGLQTDQRHRALPDARLLWQFWQVLQKEHPPEHLSKIIEGLLAGPVLPAHLDAQLVERLPELPGVYVLRGEGDNDGDAVLQVGKAANLKLHLTNYFRLDRISGKAAGISQQVRNITWRATLGAIGAQLLFKSIANTISPKSKMRVAANLCSWQLSPDAYPCLQLVAVSELKAGNDETHGLFDSEKKAHNALLRLATQHQLCHALLGIREAPGLTCAGCAFDVMCRCGPHTSRLRHFTQAVAALRPLRVAPWPYHGAIGVRERADLHVLDNWRYLGTGQTEHEVRQIMRGRQGEFDQDTFEFLLRTLPRLPEKRIVRLAQLAEREEREQAQREQEGQEMLRESDEAVNCEIDYELRQQQPDYDLS
jgi:DNA polymerase III subunit epsilon